MSGSGSSTTSPTAPAAAPTSTRCARRSGRQAWSCARSRFRPRCGTRSSLSSEPGSETDRYETGGAARAAARRCPASVSTTPSASARPAKTMRDPSSSPEVGCSPRTRHAVGTAEGDRAETGNGQRDPNHLAPTRALTERDDCKRNREYRLKGCDHRREPGRQPSVHRHEKNAKLPDPDEQTDGDNHPPA